ncbi:hypothetical protein [Pedobacter sp. KACC 23697]|uniref:Uncharacterized protein n=1 Tax=Pedobacter sp. KACC 23697 TaxID=3149230 RepID=A0AAU7K9Q9_9SPHI
MDKKQELYPTLTTGWVMFTLKVHFKPNVLAENDFSFNLLTYLNRKNIENKELENFDFSELEYFSERYKYKKMVAYAEDFCIKNNLDQIIIIRKKMRTP